LLHNNKNDNNNDNSSNSSVLTVRQAAEYAQDTVVDADGVHQSVAENVIDESARTVVGGFSTQTKTDEDVQETQSEFGQVRVLPTRHVQCSIA